MINVGHLKNEIIIPALKMLEKEIPFSESAVNLLLGTCAQESVGGYYLVQVSGPARGIFQMEPNTHDDIFMNFLIYREDLADIVCDVIGDLIPCADVMIWNLFYAVIMTRIHYYRVSEQLPHKDDVEGMAQYWKKYYNTNLGAGSSGEFMNNYTTMVLPYL